MLKIQKMVLKFYLKKRPTEIVFKDSDCFGIAVCRWLEESVILVSQGITVLI